LFRRILGSVFGAFAKAPVGTYFPDRDPPKLSAEDASLIDRFHDLYYTRWVSGEADTINLSWFGYQILKCPLDLWIYQELIVKTRPGVIVETGTFEGGSALFMAMIFDHIGAGRIISVDIEHKAHRPVHPRIRYVTGSSTDPAIVSAVMSDVGTESAMVILDSDHSANHVYDEILAYKKLVPRDGYMIVEDTNVNGHPTFPQFGPGPMEALDRFLGESSEFKIDERCQRFMMTLNPRGYLRRTG
jgi:cephalosporin hydroxylase